MLCTFCKKESLLFGWHDTSHLGRRAICYACIGNNDTKQMCRTGKIKLYQSGNTLTNQTKTLSFKIKDTYRINDKISYKCDKIKFTFLVNNKEWEGLMFINDNIAGPPIVFCRKCDTANELSNGKAKIKKAS